MTLFNPISHLTLPSLAINIFVFFLLVNNVVSISFNFSSFGPNLTDLTFQGDAFPSVGVIQLTKNQVDGPPLTSSVGRTSYAQPVRLWDASTGMLTDFTTHFSFFVKALSETHYGDGISFFISPFGSNIPHNSSGGYLGLFSSDSAFDSSGNKVVAIEFDSYQNAWDPSPDHVGINVNSIASVANVTLKSSLKNGSVANAWVSYNSTTQNLCVFLTFAKNPVYNDGDCSLSYIVDLRNALPELVSVGFSAATGAWVEIHSIRSWSFSSTLETSSASAGWTLELKIISALCLLVWRILV